MCGNHKLMIRGRRDNNVQILEDEGDMERLIPHSTSSRTEGWSGNGKLWNGP